ncbi:MAG: hypothetical protein Unbinned3818contig1000_44 [Prokaryotic dsDNA virus sp.]|nr:hypothetical protein [Phycisphaerae bacterium]QDP45973.1 MAG: hypothetical protein Unbinned3818contig1000_44 [Prokaryotic dsDNA virus sp.]
MKKVWFVKHPTSQYKEDVKALARKNDLVIYDAKFEGSINPKMVESKPPKLTLVKSEKKSVSVDVVEAKVAD